MPKVCISVEHGVWLCTRHELVLALLVLSAGSRCSSRLRPPRQLAAGATCCRRCRSLFSLTSSSSWPTTLTTPAQRYCTACQAMTSVCRIVLGLCSYLQQRGAVSDALCAEGRTAPCSCAHGRVCVQDVQEWEDMGEEEQAQEVYPLAPFQNMLQVGTLPLCLPASGYLAA